MTKLSTMGTSSCATIALQGFKDEQYELNENYINEGKSIGGGGHTVEQFYDKVLYPTKQELGRTKDYPFTQLMEEIGKTAMNDKFIIATLNAYQFNTKDHYWPKQLAKWGFQLIDKTENNIGSTCYIYTRNQAVVDIKDSDYIKE